jgi:paired small multidrug resistance pump
MNRTWVTLFFAACLEVAWVTGLKHSTGVIGFAATVFAIVISFLLLLRASEKLPVGTVYAVYVGIGTIGTVLAEIVFFDEGINTVKLFFIATLMSGVISLKFDKNEKGA